MYNSATFYEANVAEWCYIIGNRCSDHNRCCYVSRWSLLYIHCQAQVDSIICIPESRLLPSVVQNKFAKSCCCNRGCYDVSKLLRKNPCKENQSYSWATLNSPQIVGPHYSEEAIPIIVSLIYHVAHYEWKFLIWVENCSNGWIDPLYSCTCYIHAPPQCMAMTVYYCNIPLEMLM